MAIKPKATDPSELKIALDNRAFEIQLFWQRSNYFLVLMTALGIGVFAIKIPFFAVTISIFATITSWYWYKTNLGSKFWQESWEVEVTILSKELGIRSFEKSMRDIREQVTAALEQARESSGKGRIQRWLDRQVMKKPSVSHYMILLSLTSTVLWAIVSAVLGFWWVNSWSAPNTTATTQSAAQGALVSTRRQPALSAVPALAKPATSKQRVETPPQIAPVAGPRPGTEKSPHP